MNKYHVIFDSTSVHAPLRGSVLARLSQFCHSKGISVAQVTFVTLAGHEMPLGVDWVGAKTCRVPSDSEVTNAVRQIIIEQQETAICAAIYLITFNTTLLMIADEFDTSPIRVLTRHGTSFDKSTGSSEGRTRTEQVEVGWRFHNFISKRDAIQLLLKALQGVGAITQKTSLRQTFIRPALARFDARWAGKGTETGTQGIIRSLVECAAEEGLVEVDRATTDPNNPLVWIKSSTMTPVQESPDQMHLQATTGQNLSAGIGSSNANGTETPAVSRREDRPLSDEELIFREINWGPFATERWLMYEAIEQTILNQKGEPIPVNKLVDAAKKIVSKKLQDQTATEKSDGPARRRPWPAIITMFNALLPRSGALIGANDERIKQAIDAPLKGVCGLDVDFSIKADAVLVEAYLRRVKSIPQSKIFDLAGALYFDRTPETQSRVIQVLKVLQDRGQVEYAILEDGSESIRLVYPSQVLAFHPKSEIGLADVSATAN